MRPNAAPLQARLEREHGRRVDVVKKPLGLVRFGFSRQLPAKTTGPGRKEPLGRVFNEIVINLLPPCNVTRYFVGGVTVSSPCSQSVLRRAGSWNECLPVGMALRRGVEHSATITCIR